MNLLKELEPFNKDLDNWKAGHGISAKKTINALIDIWYDWQKEKTVEIWGRANHKVVKASPSCGSCLKQMMQMLYNWRTLEMKDKKSMGPVSKPKTQKMVTPSSKVNKPKPDTTEETPKIVDYSKLKWGELLTMAKSKGINPSRKKKPQIIDELNALD